MYGRGAGVFEFELALALAVADAAAVPDIYVCAVLCALVCCVLWSAVCFGLPLFALLCTALLLCGVKLT